MKKKTTIKTIKEIARKLDEYYENYYYNKIVKPITLEEVTLFAANGDTSKIDWKRRTNPDTIKMATKKELHKDGKCFEKWQLLQMAAFLRYWYDYGVNGRAEIKPASARKNGTDEKIVFDTLKTKPILRAIIYQTDFGPCNCPFLELHDYISIVYSSKDKPEKECISPLAVITPWEMNSFLKQIGKPYYSPKWDFERYRFHNEETRKKQKRTLVKRILIILLAVFAGILAVTLVGKRLSDGGREKSDSISEVYLLKGTDDGPQSR